VGLNKFIFTNEQTSYEQLFDENCILDISRVKSAESKALIMGLMVYILNEYRSDRKTKNNTSLQHVTVLEEAHHLLKNTSTGGASDLIGKSVEILTNTIAEIRTYGEGFIIVDQSPSSVDIAAIKNTNTKIVLRTPEAHDREAVGRSMGLTAMQVNEIAKLPSGVAAVYQNDWISPVLVMIDKAEVAENNVYNPDKLMVIKPSREARTDIVLMLLEPWIKRDIMSEEGLFLSLKGLEIPRIVRRMIADCIDDYAFLEGELIWSVNEIPKLQKLIKSVLDISDSEFERIVIQGVPDDLRRVVEIKTVDLKPNEVEEVCNVMTKVVISDGND
jgi:hypothetical protein